jgi:hypothetical protein
MASLCTVTVTPGLLAEGEHKGHLEYLHFTATAGDDLVTWWSVNTGTLLEDFRSLFGEWGLGIVERLRKGEKVKLPRTLELEEARRIGGAGND